MLSARLILLSLLILGCVVAVPTGLSVEINGGDDYTDDAAVMLDLSATDAENCSLSNDGTSYSDPFPFVATKAWDLTSSDGLKTVYFKCVSNNETNWSSAVTDTITLDTTAPAASSKSPTGSITDRTPEISAELSDTGSGVDSTSIVLSLDDSAVTHDYTGGEVSYTPTSDLDFGSHSVNLLVADEVGNTLNTTWTFSIASSGVGFDDYGPENNSYTGETRPKISIILVDSGSGINSSTLRMEVDDENVSASYSASSKNYSYTPSTLEEGQHKVEVWVEDNAGEESQTTWYFYVDTEGPSIGLLVPSDDAVVTDVHHISAKIEDDEAGVDDDYIFMELNSVDVSISIHYDEDTETVTFTPTVDLAPGTYTVELWARDKVGNEENIEWSFIIASSAPVISSLSPSNGSIINDQTPEISATITDSGTSGINADSIKVYLDGSQVTDDATYNAGSGKVSYTPDSDLSDGEHTAKIRARDNTMQETIVEWTFTVDSSAPSPPTDFTVTQNGSGTTLTWELSETEDVESYIIYGAVSGFTSVEGKAALATLDSDTTEYFHSITTNYYYAIVAEDENGNTAEPVFAGTCSAYSVTGGWTDYECCSDEDCMSGYSCNVALHRCERSTSESDKTDAEDLIDEAEAAITDALDAGKNVTEAQNYLEDAENAYNAGNYAQAKSFAQLAKDSAVSAPGDAEETEEEKEGCCSSTFILLAVLGFVIMRR